MTQTMPNIHMVIQYDQSRFQEAIREYYTQDVSEADADAAGEILEDHKPALQAKIVAALDGYFETAAEEWAARRAEEHYGQPDGDEGWLDLLAKFYSIVGYELFLEMRVRESAGSPDDL